MFASGGLMRIVVYYIHYTLTRFYIGIKGTKLKNKPVA